MSARLVSASWKQRFVACLLGNVCSALVCRCLLMPVGVACDCEICTPGSRSTAPATKSALQVHQVLRLPRNLYSATRGPAAPTRSRRLCVLRLPQNLRSRLTKYCACHKICTSGSKSALSHAAQRRPRNPGGCVLRRPRNLHSRLTKYCACHEIYTTLQVHQVLRLPRNLYSATHGPAVPTHAAADPGGSVHCAGHKICTPGSPSIVPATKSTLQVHQALRLPRNLYSATRGPAAPTHAAADPGGSVYCACHKICTPGSP